MLFPGCLLTYQLLQKILLWERRLAAIRAGDGAPTR